MSRWDGFIPRRGTLKELQEDAAAMRKQVEREAEIYRKAYMTTEQKSASEIRTFDTGATRGAEKGKLDYEGFLSPAVLERFAVYMDKHTTQADGEKRESDNWQKGMPQTSYMKSGWRHFMDWWRLHRTPKPLTADEEMQLEEAICATIFNLQGYLHEHLKTKK